MAVVKSGKDVKTTTKSIPGVGVVNTKTGSVVKTSTPAKATTPVKTSTPVKASNQVAQNQAYAQANKVSASTNKPTVSAAQKTDAAMKQTLPAPVSAPAAKAPLTSAQIQKALTTAAAQTPSQQQMGISSSQSIAARGASGFNQATSGYKASGVSAPSATVKQSSEMAKQTADWAAAQKQYAQKVATGEMTQVEADKVMSTSYPTTGLGSFGAPASEYISRTKQDIAAQDAELLKANIIKRSDLTKEQAQAVDEELARQETGAEQPTFDLGEFFGQEPTGVEVTADELKKQAESFVMQADETTGTAYYVSPDGTVLTQEGYASMLARLQNAINMSQQYVATGGARFGATSPAGYAGGNVPAAQAGGGLITPSGGISAGNVVANKSDSNNITSTSTGTTTLDPLAGSSSSSMSLTVPSGVSGDQAFFSNPYFEKLASMSFEYNPEDDPEYQNSAAVLENAVTQAMVGRGGMYSSVYQSALSSKLIELQLGMRKAKYDQFVDERSFMLNMAQTTFNMQMSIANYAMDYQKMAFDQEMAVKRYEADRADAAFSKQMQRNEYALKLAQYNQTQEKENAYNSLMITSEQYKYDKTNMEKLLTRWKTNRVADKEIASFFGVKLNTAFGTSSATKAYASKASQLTATKDNITNGAITLGNYEMLQLALNDFVMPQSAPAYTGISAETSSPAQMQATARLLSQINSSNIDDWESRIANNADYVSNLGWFGYTQVLNQINKLKGY